MKEKTQLRRKKKRPNVANKTNIYKFVTAPLYLEKYQLQVKSIPTFRQGHEVDTISGNDTTIFEKIEIKSIMVIKTYDIDLHE